MKLIFSRKGFDSSAGGVPSPIFPDGRMKSLPIPDKFSSVAYGDILYEGVSLGPVVSDLTKGRIPSHYRAHIDPDVEIGSLTRMNGWRPVFGQTGPAQSHLRNNHVGPGDIFLFFGLFQHVEIEDGFYAVVRESLKTHVVWGWFQVAEVLHFGSTKPTGYPWMEYHPHYNRTDPNNTIYLAEDWLKIDGLRKRVPGAGAFSHFSEARCLTKSEAEKPSVWELPGWFYPKQGRKTLTYHSDPARWKSNGSRAELRSVGRGQEFVLDCEQYPEAPEWVCGLIQGGN